MIGEITKGYIDWIMIGVIQKDGIDNQDNPANNQSK